MKITKENAIASVQSSVSSIFSKEDVLNLINSIEGGRVVTVLEIQRGIDGVIEYLERETDDVIDYTSAEFTIRYDSRIEVDSINLNFDLIRDALENNFMDLGEVDE